MPIFRILKIYYIALKYDLFDIVANEKLSIKLIFLISKKLLLIKQIKHLSRGQRYRLALEELGPIFIKIGQLLSTRLDLIPEDLYLELVNLQDNVTAFSGDLVLPLLKQEFKDLEQHITYIDLKPLATGSIAQVHAATLTNGKNIIFKILRPNIHVLINKDIKLIKFITKILSKFNNLKRLKLELVAIEIEKTLLAELDLSREAANASKLRRNFDNSHLLYVPYIYWPLTNKNILAQERLTGITIANIKEMHNNKVDLKKLAEKGVEIFFTQVFRDSFFHGDMHPGNVWVNIENPNNPQYLSLDFGIMGTLDKESQHYLAANFLAFFENDYKKVAELHINSGWVPSDTVVSEFEAAIRTVCEPIFAKSLNEISFGKTLANLFHTAKQFNMEIQPQLILLQKTLISIEGLGRQLYPDLDLWTTAKPYLEQWLKKKVSIKHHYKQLKNHSLFWLEKLPLVPELIYNKLSESNNSLQIQNNKLLEKSIRAAQINNVLIIILIGALFCLFF